MADGGSLLAFTAAALVLLLLPGPGVLYVVTRSLSQGRGAGVASAAGLSAGAMVQAGAATVGLTAVLLTSSAAFGVVKILGAGYLIYLGLRAIFSAQPSDGSLLPPPRSRRRLFGDGVMVSVLNPKIAVFFMAFLPQFVDPGRGSPGLQILVLGLWYSVLAFVTDGAYAVAAAGLRGRLQGPWLEGPVPRYASGVVYMGLGAGTLFVERR